MIINLTASICFGIVILVLIIDFNSKEKLNNIDNKCFKYLSIFSFVGLLLEFITYLSVQIGCDKHSLILLVFGKAIFIYYIIFMYFFIMYVFSVCFVLKTVNKKFKRFVFFESIIYILFALLMIFLPFDYSDSERYLYPIGPATDFSYLIGGIGILFTCILCITKIKVLKTKKALPIIITIISAFICTILQMKFHDLILLIPSHAIVILIMYHTIENPDVKMIAQLNEAKAQAEKANNAKSEFLSSMSHEIRTPLNAIVGFSQALSEEDLSDEAREEVKDIISASNTLLEIVNGILDISKIEANKLEIINKEYNFKNIFDELVALTKGRLGEKPLDFKYIYDESIPSVLYGDSVRVKQIILNLLTNSVKYTKEGSITFTVNSVKKDDVIRLIVSVEDTGIGIKEENIGKLFTKFERFDEKNTTIEGTGLGLAITKQLVELMNGKIVVQSVYGKGSKFTVALDQKIVHGKVIESKDNNEDVVEFDLTGKKVLIVDDNNLNLKVASRLIKNYKCDITTVTSGIECLDKINNKEVFDLILMDDMMPRMSGGETLIRLKKIEGFNIPVVALTANAVTGMKEKYLQQGFDDYLAKPIEKGELNRVLHKFLKED